MDSKFSIISGEIQDIKQYSSAEISRLSAALGDLQAKLVTGTSDSISAAVPVRADVRSEVVQQVDNVINTAGSNNALLACLERMVQMAAVHLCVMMLIVLLMAAVHLCLVMLIVLLMAAVHLRVMMLIV